MLELVHVHDGRETDREQSKAEDGGLKDKD